MNRTIAVVPAKGFSGRVENKNFRSFYGGRALLDIKIEQCKKSGVFDAIYISSDDARADIIAQQHNVNFVLRDEKLCLDETPWSEVLCGILNKIPESDDALVAWCPPTSPIFTRYAEAVKFLSEQSLHDSLMTVTPLKHYFLGADFIPLNFQFGVWASYSQKLKPIYQMNCALWLAPKGKMLANRFQTGDSPFFMELTATEGVDIDTMEEFELAQWYYEREFGSQHA